MITLGRHSYIYEGLDNHWQQRAEIGNFTSISRRVELVPEWANHLMLVSTYPFRELLGLNYPSHGAPSDPYPPLRIGHDVWICQGVRLVGQLVIGDGAVIGAGAVVARDVPPYAVVVGNPGRVIRYRFDTQTIVRLCALRWWDWSDEEVRRAVETGCFADPQLLLNFER